MHTITLLLTYYLNISVQAAYLSDCRIESNSKNRFGSENRIESKLFLPELECSNLKYITYRNVARGGLSHIDNMHNKKLSYRRGTA